MIRSSKIFMNNMVYGSLVGIKGIQGIAAAVVVVQAVLDLVH